MCWLVNHIVRAQNEAVNVLHGLTASFLSLECLTHVNQARHKGILSGEVCQQVVNVPRRVRNDRPDQIAHWSLQVVRLLVDVERVRRREECHGSMYVSWVAPSRVLLDHEALNWTGLHHILRNRPEQRIVTA